MDALDDESIVRVSETARDMLGTSHGLELRNSSGEEFARKCFEMDVAKLKSTKELNRPAIFDRGLGDALGHHFLLDRAIPESLKEAASNNRYSGPVFDFPPWQEIYCQDNLRKQNFAEAIESHKAVTAAWRELGYLLTEVPKVGIKARAAWVKKQCS